MNEFFLGVFAGAGVFGLGTIIWLQHKILDDMNAIKTNLVNILGFVMRIDKTTQASMVASEGFVDALRQSADQFNGMMGGGSLRPPTQGDMRDHFRDLRSSFEDGINKFQDEDDDEEEGPEEGPKEDWKKKK